LDRNGIQKTRIWIRDEQNESISIHFRLLDIAFYILCFLHCVNKVLRVGASIAMKRKTKSDRIVVNIEGTLVFVAI